jgi:carnitine 3-dehydrogenase
MQVTVSDPAADAEEKVRAFVAQAWPTLDRLGTAKVERPRDFAFFADPGEAVVEAQLIQENAPEKLEIKRELYARLDAAMPAEAVLASSTSGLLISELQDGRIEPGGYVIGHPVNPPSVSFDRGWSGFDHSEQRRIYCLAYGSLLLSNRNCPNAS